MPWDVTENFEYVVFARPPPKVAFGSGLARKALLMNYLMRKYTAEERPKIAPSTYHNPLREAFYQTLTKPSSTAGYGGKAARFRSVRTYQPPRRPLSPPEPTRQNCAPFNSTTRRTTKLGNNNPAPCDYSTSQKQKQMRFAYSFNGKKTLLCVVQLKCVPYNLDMCGVCGVACSSQGDYWHFENRIFLCRDHYARLFKKPLSKYQDAKLAEFKSIRDCFFAHLHNSCTASVKLMTREQIERKLRKEAYLDLYFPQRKSY